MVNELSLKKLEDAIKELKKKMKKKTSKRDKDHLKRLMKVYITHKAGDNLTLQAAYDGGSFTNKFASNTLSTSATMTQSTFTVSTIENCKSIQFKIAGTAEADFVLEDISVVYRRKGLR